MSEKSEQLKKLIEAVVRKEVRAIVPQIVKEVMAGMILESHTPSVAANTNYGNSDKRMSLMEESYNQQRGPMVEWDGDDFPLPGRAGRTGGAHGLNLPTAAISEQGNVVPIDPSRTPDAVVRAMNTDYRDFMKILKDKTNHG